MVAQNKYVDEVFPKSPWLIDESNNHVIQSSLQITKSTSSVTTIFPIRPLTWMMPTQFVRNWESSKRPKELKEYQQLMWLQRSSETNKCTTCEICAEESPERNSEWVFSDTLNFKHNCTSAPTTLTTPKKIDTEFVKIDLSVV